MFCEVYIMFVSDYNINVCIFRSFPVLLKSLIKSVQVPSRSSYCLPTYLHILSRSASPSRQANPANLTLYCSFLLHIFGTLTWHDIHIGDFVFWLTFLSDRKEIVQIHT